MKRTLNTQSSETWQDTDVKKGEPNKEGKIRSRKGPGKQ